MTPKEKAEELYNKFNPHVLQRDFFGDDVEKAKSKQCALIAVEEILKAIRKDSDFTITYEKAKEYYQQVKKEIEAL